MKLKYLVTGGAGFIGSHLVELLVKKGHKVRVLDNFSTGFASYLKPFQGKVEVQKGDVRNTRDCLRAVRGVEVVFHEAAFTSVAKSVETPSEVHEIDATGTLNMLEAAKTAGVRRFVYASSCSVYGNATRFPLREGDPIKPLSPYAVAKLTGELYTYSYFVNYGLETVALRYFNVFGSRQNPMSKYSAAVPGILSRLKKGQAPVIYGDGKQSRDFVHADDVAMANFLASKVPAAK
ncbi:MAG TPA: NAD-dependent epimerase/dehydratase family protein, partial [Candidatus Omnitrophota bacterium]|nr:NAD-dependent epimerase/dehydratase family protein [Candidatus Omnitrophota bacterium]